MSETAAPEAGAAARGAPRPRKPFALASHATLLTSLAILGLVLLAWQVLPPALDVPKFIVPTLGDCLAELGRMWRVEGLLRHTASTALSRWWEGTSAMS